MCLAGRANGTLNVPSIVGLCASPMPSTSRPCVSSDVVNACAASMRG